MTTTKKGPFSEFQPKTAEKILDLAEKLCINEVDAAAHLSAALVSLTPSVDHAIQLVKHVDFMATKEERKAT